MSSKNLASFDDALLLSTQLLTLVNSSESGDVLFKVGHQESPIYAHKSILSARSPVFNAMFYGPLKETANFVSIPNIEPEAFLILMKYIYSGGVCDLSQSNAVQVLSAANQYEQLSLMSTCIEFIQHSLSLENVCSYLIQTQGSYIDIYEICMEFIETHAKEVFDVNSNETFLSLSEDMLIDLLKRDYLCIDELDLFKAVVKWGQHQCHEEYTRASSRRLNHLASSMSAPASVAATSVLSRVESGNSLNSFSIITDNSPKILQEALKHVIKYIRLPLIDIADLKSIVRETDVVPVELYIAALEHIASNFSLKSEKAPAASIARINRAAFDESFFEPRNKERNAGKLFEFFWDPTGASGFLLDANNLNATKVGIKGWSAVFGDKSISAAAAVSQRNNPTAPNKSRYVLLFEVCIKTLNADKSGMIIGLAKKSDKDNFSNCIGYGGDGNIYPKPSSTSSGSTTAVSNAGVHGHHAPHLAHDEGRDIDMKFYEGDVIGVKYDTLKRQISFYKNGNLQFTNAKTPSANSELFPVVFMHYNYDAVTIRR